MINPEPFESSFMLGEFPLPSITGGASGASADGTVNNRFGNINQNGGFGIWAFAGAAVLVAGLIWLKHKKKL